MGSRSDFFIGSINYTNFFLSVKKKGTFFTYCFLDKTFKKI